MKIWTLDYSIASGTYVLQAVTLDGKPCFLLEYDNMEDGFQGVLLHSSPGDSVYVTAIR